MGYAHEGDFVPRDEEIITTSISWIKTDGTTIPVYNGPIKFNRNKQTIVTVNLDQESESLGTKVEIDLEDTPMTPGEEVTINPGDQVAGWFYLVYIENWPVSVYSQVQADFLLRGS